MDPRLLEYYNRELSYLRETGAEFATLHPKIAARLGMQGTDIADPYVERMIEAFSFLSARTQLKIDAEFPRFTQRLLEVVSPNYVTPTPSMAVVKLYPDTQEGDLAKGVTVPRDTAFVSPIPEGENTACQFGEERIASHLFELLHTSAVATLAGEPGHFDGELNVNLQHPVAHEGLEPGQGLLPLTLHSSACSVRR